MNKFNFLILVTLVLAFVTIASYLERSEKPGSAIAYRGAVSEEEVVLLAKNIYFHRGHENTDPGKVAIIWVVLNRMNDKGKRFPHTISTVINGGQNRGKNCDFSWTCDGRSDTPGDLLRFKKEIALVRNALAQYQKRSHDPTMGATWFIYYKDKPPKNWPRLQKTITAGQYTFYRYP